MYCNNIVSIFAALFSLAFALPHRVPLALRATNGSRTGRPNPAYTKDQLNEIKLAMSTVDRLTYIQSLGDTDDYFKFDFSIAANPVPVAGADQGGQGDLAYVDNFQYCSTRESVCLWGSSSHVSTYSLGPKRSTNRFIDQSSQAA